MKMEVTLYRCLLLTINWHPTQIIVPVGKVLGGVEVQFTDAFFYDPKTIQTAYVIPLRMTSVQNADTILVFGDGKIVECGNHQELVNQNGIYASMWKEYQTQITWKVGKSVGKEKKHD